MARGAPDARRASLGIVFVTVLIDLIGFGIVIPLLPVYVTSLDSSPTVVGFVMASFTLMQFIFNPVFGRMSDRHGRRPFIMLGLLGSFVSYIMFAFAGSVLVLLASRLLAGVFNANVAVAQAYVSDVTPSDQRAKGMGMIGAAFGIGFTFGPMIGGVSAGLGEHFLGSVWGFRLPGLVAAGFSLLAFVWAWVRLEESLPVEARSRPAERRARFATENLRLALARPMLAPLLILFFLEVFSFANFEASFVLFGDARWGFTKMQAGLYIGYVGIISAMIQGGLIGRLTKRFGETRLLSAGFLLLSLGLFLLPLSASPSLVLLTLAPIPMGIALINPTVPATISRLARPEERGGLLGLSQGVASLGRIIGQPYGTTVFQHAGMAVPFYSGAVLMAIAFVVSLVTLHPPAPE